MKQFIAILFIAFALGSCKKVSPEEQAEIDEQVILDYIASRNLDATSTSSGLYYVMDVIGTGTQAPAGATVTVAYRGRLTDGATFDESPTQGISFALDNVIQGWQEGIPLFKEGGEGILIIPSALGYGTSGTGDIPPNSVLVFDISLIEVL